MYCRKEDDKKSCIRIRQYLYDPVTRQLTLAGAPPASPSESASPGWSNPGLRPWRAPCSRLPAGHVREEALTRDISASSFACLNSFSRLALSSLVSLIGYDMVWYGMTWFGMIWYGVVWYGMIWYGIIGNSMMWYSMIWCDVVRYHVIWYGMIWCDNI